MKKCFSVSMLIVGTIIGAGFASGRELISFFGEKIPLIISLICAVIVFALTYIFLTIGAKIKSDKMSVVNSALAGKAHIFVDIFLLVNNFIVLAGMLAGMDSLGSMFFKIAPLYSIVSGLLCIFVVYHGMKGLLNCNKIVVPIIIIALVSICFLTFSPDGFSGAKLSINHVGSAVIYNCMNMMLAGTVLTTVHNLDKKTILLSSLISALVIGALIFLLSVSLNASSFAKADMPVLELARAINPLMFGLIVLIVAVAIFTTMLTAMSGLVSWFEPILGNKFFACIIIFFGAIALSNLGFANVVSFLYPVIGLLGLCYSVIGIIFVSKSLPLFKARKTFFKHRNPDVHQRGKSAKNQS